MHMESIVYHMKDEALDVSESERYMFTRRGQQLQKIHSGLEVVGMLEVWIRDLGATEEPQRISLCRVSYFSKT